MSWYLVNVQLAALLHEYTHTFHKFGPPESHTISPQMGEDVDSNLAVTIAERQRD